MNDVCQILVAAKDAWFSGVAWQSSETEQGEHTQADVRPLEDAIQQYAYRRRPLQRQERVATMNCC
jgi:hypothetical protein